MLKSKRVQVVLFGIGIALFLYSLYALGGAGLELLVENFSWKYMGIYGVLTVLSLAPFVWRWQSILKGYGESIGFFKLLRMQLAGYAVSFFTPSSRIGGEPLRIYMLKKECDVDYKTGTASIVLDKYMEYMGSLTFGLLGVVLLIFMPGMPNIIRYVLFSVIILCMVVLSYVYYRLIYEKGLFYNLFSIFLTQKRLDKMSESLKNVDSRLSYFIIHKKVAFIKSYSFYLLSATIFILEFKYLLLSFGVTTNLLELIVIVMLIGLMSLVPLPMALGSMEAGQGGFFALIKGDASIGLLLSLVHRVRGILLSAVGFLLLAIFSGKGILKASREKK
jgi:uncharacterized protein (TIRG00374 family)